MESFSANLQTPGRSRSHRPNTPARDQTRYQELKAAARTHAGQMPKDSERLTLARTFCAQVVGQYWRAGVRAMGVNLPVAKHELLLKELSPAVAREADELGEIVATMPVEYAGYLIGSIYTVMLPANMRAEMGAYYTPPGIVSRLLDIAEESGVDFASCKAIDPACGGGAFLAPVALRMIRSAPHKSARRLFDDITKRLRGIELDPFAAWITHVLVEVALLPHCVAAKTRLPPIVQVGNALDWEDNQKYDLVIGNPPYGRVTLDATARKRYARSLYGHANLYGLFTDLALRMVAANGTIAYVTPTSFLGGQYFKSLRQLLSQSATPTSFDFIADREGVFDDVLQETVLVAYKAANSKRAARVSAVIPRGIDKADIERVGKVHVSRDGGPWLIPRQQQDEEFVKHLTQMPTRLADLGYKVSTGPLVWNRHKAQLRRAKHKAALPIIWAESVTQSGFSFSASRRNHAPFIELKDQPHLVTHRPCVLLQRTTAKEQERRLISAVLPQKFIEDAGGVVVENHLNMIYPQGSFAVSVETIAAILNSRAADRAFRCINGSVAVSAYELEALPLPNLPQVREIEEKVRRGVSAAALERRIAAMYEEGTQ